MSGAQAEHHAVLYLRHRGFGRLALHRVLIRHPRIPNFAARVSGRVPSRAKMASTIPWGRAWTETASESSSGPGGPSAANRPWT